MRSSHLDRILLVLIISFIPQFLYAQKSPKRLNSRYDNWVKGEIAFKNGTKKNCTFSYNPLVPEGLLKVKEDGKIITATVFDVDFFTYFDEEKSEKRKFVSFPVRETKNYFLEILFESPLFTLLGHDKVIVTKRSADGTGTINGPNTRTYINAHYTRYLFDMKSSTLHPLEKGTILKLMEDKKSEIRKFIKSNNLKMKKTSDCIKVIKKYNELSSN